MKRILIILLICSGCSLTITIQPLKKQQITEAFKPGPYISPYPSMPPPEESILWGIGSDSVFWFLMEGDTVLYTSEGYFDVNGKKLDE